MPRRSLPKSDRRSVRSRQYAPHASAQKKRRYILEILDISADSMPSFVSAISAMDLEVMLSLIKRFAPERCVEFQHQLLEACLK